MELTKRAKEVLSSGFAKARVERSGIFQQVTLKVITKSKGNIKYVALSTDKSIGPSDLARIADELGLPVEAQNGFAFPKGKSALDFRTE